MDTIPADCENITTGDSEDPSPGHFVKIVVLCLINLAVILGNSLVIAAVFTTRKLRTVTNIFIVSLACADLLLGVAVLPFSISLEVVDIWPWGQIWCSMWLAIDVWLCTASILSLCAISLDRYIAVTHPIRYPSIMSGARGRVLVSCVWVLSFVICLPPLLGWNDGTHVTSSEMDLTNAYSASPNLTISNVTSVSYSLTGMTNNYALNTTAEKFLDGLYSNQSVFFNTSDKCSTVDKLTCELTPTIGYRIYAAMGSFYIPMLIMSFFYFRIYLTAVKTAASIRRGVLTMRTSNELAPTNGSGEEEMHLRVHRGGSNSLSRYSSVKNYEWQRAPSTRQPTNDESRSPRLSRNSRLSASIKAPNIRETNGRAHLIVTDTNGNGKHENGVSWHSNIFRPVTEQLRKSMRRKFKGTEDVTEMTVINTNGTNGKNDVSNSKEIDQNGEDNSSGSSSPFKAIKRSPRRCKLLIRDGKGSVSVKGHARKFKREAKAAKTLAIIVGAFIICWLPFFTIYLVGAFCHNCVSDIIFAIFFWLGYCNSALNPCIYALFARDFRSAFTRLLLCQRRKRFTQAARADYVTGNRNRLTPPVHENDSASDI